MKILLELKNEVDAAAYYVTASTYDNDDNNNIDAIDAYNAYAVATDTYAKALAIAAKDAEVVAKDADANLVAFVSGRLQYINLCRRSGSVKMKTVFELERDNENFS